jgi:hypothetical protein
LFERRFAQPLVGEQTSFSRHEEYEKLADWLQRYLDIAQLKAICELE